MSDPSISHRPKQARALKTEQALLDALETLLARKPFADLTVSELAREAGLTTGAIYRRFKDKDDVLRAAFQRFYNSSKVRTLTIEADFPPAMSDRQVLEKYLTDLMHFTLDHIHLMRAANHLNDAPSFELMTRARAISAEWLAGRLTGSKHAPDELNHRCQFILRAATATFRDTFFAGAGAVTETSEYEITHREDLAQLSHNLTELACAYLAID